MCLNKYRTVCVLFFFIFLMPNAPDVLAQVTVRIMSYNLNDYASDNSRDSYFISVISTINPDIFVGIELTSSTRASNFRTNVLNQTGHGTYSMGTFLVNPENSSDNNAIYYKSSAFSVISQSMIIPSNSYGNHPTYRFVLQHTSTGEQIVIFGTHLSSGSTSSDRNQRTAEVNIIRGITDAYSSGIYFIAAGDFNLGSGTEQAFKKLLNSTNTGYFIDPFGFTGFSDWSQDKYYTHASNSLSNRYDLILNSQSVVDAGGIKYQNNTFTIGGNDGIHNPPSSYQNASDHLPVYADYTFADALPVELSMFSSVLNGNQVDLRWTTETEVNNYGFNVERSVENNEWTTIAFVDGNGNSNSPKYYYYPDKDIYRSGNYSYRLKQIDNDGTFKYSGIVNLNVTIPGKYYLSQNYPNPFNPETRIDFTLPEKQFVSLKVYNTLGELVKTLVNEQREPGNYSEVFNAANLPSGVYIYRLETENFSENKKLTLLK